MLSDTDAQWVPVAVAHDIPNGVVVPGRLPSGPIAIWRSASGALYANGDRCPHRGMRLSHGFVRGDSLSCIYHGWRYGPDGACTHIPAHPDVVPPASINCGPLPVAERNGVVWASAAQPSGAPPELSGYEALRSLAMATDVSVIALYGEPTGDGFALELGAQRALLLAAPQDEGTFVIALVAQGLGHEALQEASAALEALRRDVETKEAAA